MCSCGRIQAMMNHGRQMNECVFQATYLRIQMLITHLMRALKYHYNRVYGLEHWPPFILSRLVHLIAIT